jgi:branched-chain amino acid transport system permease protein
MQLFLNGIANGLPLALLAIAFSLVYLPARVFYIAMAGVYITVPFIAWSSLQIGIPLPVSCLLSILSGMLISVLCEICNHWPLEKRKSSSGAHMVSSLGIYIVISQIVCIVWGNETKVLRTGLDQVFHIQGLLITMAQVLSIVIPLCFLFGFALWLNGSKLGLCYRALSDNPNELALKGYNLRKLRLLCFATSGLFCSVSALLVAYDIGFDAHGGLAATLLAVVAMIVGGKQSFAGPVVGAILLGVLRANVVWLLSSRWEDAVTFGLLALFLLFRPGGLLTRQARMEATT